MATTCGLILSVMLAAAGGQEGVDSATPKAQAVLTAEHFWRKHYTYIPPRISERAAKAAGIATDPASRAKALAKRCRSDWSTPAPAAGWMKPSFDDSSWSQSRGRQFVSASGGYSQMKYQPHNLTNQLHSAFRLHPSIYPCRPVIYDSVSSCAGFVNNSSVLLNSISLPNQKKPVQSDARAACCILCVTITMV